MSIQHPYRDGYSVLPGLRKISENEIFQTDPVHYMRCLTEKQSAIKTQECCFRHQLDAACELDLINWIKKTYPAELTHSEKLDELVMQMHEDIIVHCIDESSDWMAYGHVCFPSGWLPQEKIGRNFEEIHQPVVGMDLSKSRQLVKSLIQHGPFERFVWSVVFEDAINFHPHIVREKFSPDDPHVWVKVERQVTVGFPKHNALLFLLNQYLIPEVQLDKPALCSAIENMSTEELAYKGMTHSADQLIHWLKSTL